MRAWSLPQAGFFKMFREKEMLPARNTGRGKQAKGCLFLFLRALLCLPGVWRPRAARRPFVLLLQNVPALAGSPAAGGVARRDAPPFSPRPAGSVAGLSSVSSALLLPLSTPLARSWLLFSLNGRKKFISEQFKFYRRVHFCLILV